MPRLWAAQGRHEACVQPRKNLSGHPVEANMAMSGRHDRRHSIWQAFSVEVYVSAGQTFYSIDIMQKPADARARCERSPGARILPKGATMRLRRRQVISGSLALAAGASGLPLFARPAGAVATPVPMPGTAACDPYAQMAPVPTFTLTSTDVTAGELLPTAQMSGIAGAGGADESPQLAWSGFPDETRSFVVSMFDPDAPSPSGFWHWAVADIPASVTELPSGAGAAGGASLPQGAFQLRNDAGLAQYLGAAPPAGDPPHRYFIAVTAADVDTLQVDKDATPALLYATLAGHTLARAIIVPIAAPAG
jgi:Raf kinase inhibitor-like YbhB/YbcL family protein